MTEDLVDIHQLASGIAVVSLNRPDKRNALNRALLTEFCKAIESIQEDKSQRVLIVRGEGTCFCAGMDLKEAKDKSVALESAGLIERALKLLSFCPLISIAAVHGAAIAGGAGLMSACDFVVAEEGTKIGYPEVHRGLVAGLVMGFLARQVNERTLKEILLLGEVFSASDACKYGLVNQVCQVGCVDEEAVLLAQRAMKGAPGALALTKQMIRERSPSVAEELKRAEEYHLLARSSGEAEEGMSAFLEKREPSWVGA